MEFQDEDRIFFKSHYLLDDETEQKLSELFKRARSTSNKEQARCLLMRADTLVNRGYLAQLGKLGEF